MIENRENLGEHIKTINNTECIVEIYFDRVKSEINEVKCLNYNRCKTYNYTLSEYADSLKEYKLEGLLELELA